MEPAGSLDGCNKEDCSEDEVDSTEEDSSDGEWITPSNIAEIKKEMGSLTLEEVPIPVACISTDFAVQVCHLILLACLQVVAVLWYAFRSLHIVFLLSSSFR